MKSIVCDIPDRKTHLFGLRSLEIGYPWLSFGAILALEEILTPKSNVLEFGSGGSTIFFANRARSVRTYESDLGWLESVKKATSNLPNIEFITSNRKEIITQIENEPDNYYDVVLVDSNPRQTDRLAIANAAKSKVRLRGFLVIDNYSAFGTENFDYEGFNVLTFDEIGFKGNGTRICQKK